MAQWTPKTEYKTVVCALQANTDVKDAIIAHGAEVICLARRRPSILAPHKLADYIFGSLKDIIHIIKKYDVDVVQCHLSDAEFLGITAARLAGVGRVITTVHYPDLLPQRRGLDPRNFLRWLATGLLYCLVDDIIAVSEDVAVQINTLWHTGTSKLRIMVNRIDVRALENVTVPAGLRRDIGLQPTDFMLLTVARLMPPKGHRYLIAAMAQLAKRHPHLKLVLAGDGDLMEPLKRQVAEMSLVPRVFFLGSRQDIPQLLALSDVFVLPSLWEGTSLALLEAMAAGKPIVTTDIPGNRKVLADGRDAVLVDPANSGALAAAIEALMTDGSRAEAMGQQARKNALDHFDIRRSIQELKMLWH